MTDPGKTVFVHAYFRHTLHGVTLVHSYWRHAPRFAAGFMGAGAACHRHGRKGGHHALGLILILIGVSLLSFWIWGFFARAAGALVTGLWRDFDALKPLPKLSITTGVIAVLMFIGYLFLPR